MLEVTLFDYGVGNLHSLGKALEKAGARTCISGDPSSISLAKALVLPAVGALATADYGGPFAAAWRKDNTYGVQFHPEKSSAAGQTLLRNWVSFAESLA